ncbi:hypothetical protein H2O64_08695 [Kordia sp. YSTF-M3]|uniref:Natural product n=1 Tax=Kordia aestuariivivens TaxID=2759037 RepID=A0ABR7Q8Q9_9FLAO|nr:hypothetical protein [Kordia aestuariivivens]MBC8754746.1 hypothetical protein [Kordia aestuariivivens]
MKKKNLKNLILHKHKISDFTLLQRQIGGTLTNTEPATETSPSGEISVQIVCPTEVLYCISLNFTDCATNNGTVKAPPPTEHEGCDGVLIGG